MEIKSLDTNAVAISLNRLLANFQIHYQKLRNFHWNVEGPHFFELHEQFEIEYNEVKTQIDAIAERIRTLDGKPYSTLAKYLEISDIKEAGTDLKDAKMVEQIVEDFDKLIPMLREVIEVAQAQNDLSTEDMMIGFKQRIEKRRWMFVAWLQKM